MRIAQILGWPNDDLNAVCWTKNGRNILIGSDDGSVRAWGGGAGDKKTIQSDLHIHSGPVKSVDCTKEGVLVVGSADCSISVWNLKSGALIHRIYGFMDWIRGVRCSPNGKVVAVVSADQTLKIFCLKSFELTSSVSAHSDIIRAVAWSSDGNRISTVCASGHVKVWRFPGLELVGELKLASGLTCVSWLYGDRFLAVGGIDRKVEVLNSETLIEKSVLIGHRDSILSISFSEKLRVLASGSADRTIKLWDIDERRCKQTLEGHKGSIRGLCWSPSGKELASASSDRSLRVWQMTGLKKGSMAFCSGEYIARPDAVRCGVLQSAPLMAVLGMGDKAAEIYEINGTARRVFRMEASTSISIQYTGKSSQIIEKRRQRTEEWIRSISISPNPNQKIVCKSEHKAMGGLIALAADDAEIRLVNLDSCSWSYNGFFVPTDFKPFQCNKGDSTSCLSWSSDERILAIGVSNSIYLWGIFRADKEQESSAELISHNRDVIAVTWSIQSTHLFSSGLDLKIISWDVSTGKNFEFDPVDTVIIHLSVSADDKFLAGAGAEGSLFIWDSKKFNLLQSIRIGREELSQIRWSTNGEYVLVASRNGAIDVVSTNGWQLISTVPAPRPPRINLDFIICPDEIMFSENVEIDEKATLRTIPIRISKPREMPRYRVTAGLTKEAQEPIPGKRALEIFVSYAREDRSHAAALYHRLKRAGFKPWLDEEDALPGIEWREVFSEQVRKSDIVLICLSEKSTRKIGYLQKEIRVALDAAEERPFGEIYIVPVRLEDCPIPKKLSLYNAADLFNENGWEKLLRALMKKVESR